MHSSNDGDDDDDGDEKANLDREQGVYNYLPINPPRIVVTPVMTLPPPAPQFSKLQPLLGSGEGLIRAEIQASGYQG